jgi:Transglutaminase-like enzymes, putative cysteine proteases
MTLPRHGRLWLLAALTAALLPQLLRLPPWFIPYCVALLGWRLAIDLRDWPLPPRWLRVLLTLVGIGGVLAGYRTLFGADAGLALLTVMLGLKLLELRSLRDAMVVIFMGYFVVAGGFLVDQSIYVGVYLLVNVLLLTAALIALSHPAGPQHPFYLRRAGLLLLQALPITVLLFVLFPRLSEPLWGVPKTSSSASTGISDHMTLNNISELVDSEEVAFRVRFDGPVPPASQLYWRGPVLWVTDGRRWDPVSRDLPPRWQMLPGRYDSLDDPVRYALTLEAHNAHWIFPLDLPASVPNGMALTADFQLLSKRKVIARQRYELASHTRYVTGPLADEMYRLGLRLPTAANPRTRALAAQWAHLPAQAIVDSAINHFRDQPFWYSRRPPPLGDHPVDDFLFTTRRGFCEHYAAAFVTLMRAAGVPARVVTGYQGGEVNPVSDYLIVRQSDAHAWAEVWLDSDGWVRVDPTAAIPPHRVEATTDAQRFRSTDAATLNIDLDWAQRALAELRYRWDAVNDAWNQWILGYNHQRQKELLEQLGLLRFGWQGVIALLAGAIAAVLGAVTIYLLLRMRGRHDALVRIYQRYCDKLARIGLRRAPHEGPRDFARRVAAQRPDLADSSDEIITLYIDLRYGKGDAATSLPLLRAAVSRFHPGVRRASD